MSKYPEIFFPNIGYQSNYFNKNISNDSIYKRNLNSFVFNRANSINKPKLKITETPFSNKTNFLTEKLMTTGTINNSYKKKNKNLFHNKFSTISNSSDDNVIKLQKRRNQRKSIKNKYLKQKISQSLDVTRPKLIMKKTKPDFYLPKLITIPSPIKEHNLYSDNSNNDFFSNKELEDNINKKNFYKNTYLHSEENVMNKRKNFEPLFIEKRITYYNLKNLRFNIKDPIERSKVMKFINNFNNILTINKC